MGAAERAGSGSQKILNVVVKNNFKKPDITTSLEKTVFKLWIANLIDVTPSLSEIEKSIYKLLDYDLASNDIKILSSNDISDRLPEYSKPQIMRALRKLIEKQLIQKIGGNRNRRYIKRISSLEVIKNMDELVKLVKNQLK